MRNIKNYVKQNMSLPLACGIILILTGCAVHKIPIYANTSSATPQLAGKRVAVLPPAAIGGEAKMAIDIEKAMDAIFSTEIAGIRFSNGNVLMPMLKQYPEEAEQLLRHVRNGVSPYFMPVVNINGVQEKEKKESLPFNRVKGEVRVLLDSDVVAGKQQKRKCNVTMDVSNSVVALAPEQLDSPLLKALDTDYVLTSVSFGYYVKTKHVMALYGILPFGGHGLMRRSPRGVFALYESQSGKKVWEGQIGTDMFNDSDPTPDKLPESTHLVVGAAYLLTGDAQTPLARILDEMALQEKNK